MQNDPQPNKKTSWCKRDGHNRICLTCGRNAKFNPDGCTCLQHQEAFLKKQEYQRSHYQKNKVRLNEANRRYREAHPETKDKNKKYQKEWYKKNLEQKIAKNLAWEQKNRNERRKYHKEYHASHREQGRESNRRSYHKHKAKKNARRGEQLKAARLRSPGHRARYNLRSLLGMHLKRKGLKTYSIRKQVLLYTSDELRAHLEKQFTPNMNWDNYGKGKYWEVDHIIECDSFDLTKLDQAIMCFALSNLRPLPINENRSRFHKEKRSGQAETAIQVSQTSIPNLAQEKAPPEVNLSEVASNGGKAQPLMQDPPTASPAGSMKMHPKEKESKKNQLPIMPPPSEPTQLTLGI